MPVTFSPTQPSSIGPGFEDAKVYDAMRAAPDPSALTAGDAAGTDLVTIDSDAPLEQAAKVMAEVAALLYGGS